MTRRLPVAASCVLLCLVLSGHRALAGAIERVSVSSAEEEGNDTSGYPGGFAISADARFVAFHSEASNLVLGDTNRWEDVFVRDRLTGDTERVSVSSAGEEGEWGSIYPAISADGRFVTFQSDATNLVPGDTNLSDDVFVRDRLAGTTERVSVSGAGYEANGLSRAAAISADGRFIAFWSEATNLVPSDTNGCTDVFVRDRLAGTTERVNVSSAGAQGNGDSFFRLSISADGRFVAFQSDATNLVPGDTNGCTDVFVRDRLAGTTERASVSSAGEEGNSLCYVGGISADGRYVAFTSYADNLVLGDSNRWEDVFVRDRLAGTTERVSVSGAGDEGDGESFLAAISADGRFVAFQSEATNLVPGDTNDSRDIMVHDRLTGATERVSVSSAGEEGQGDSYGVAVSADGRCLAFGSGAPNLVPGDTNGYWDVFVRDRKGFLDVPLDHWAYDEIMACVDANIVKGYADYLYHPELSVTRDQMAVYIARSLVSPSGDAAIPDPEPPPSFSDVPPTHWAYKHIEYAVSQNVVKGYDDGTYLPTVTVDRGTMAVYVARAMVAPGGDAAIPDPPATASFADVPTAFWAYEQVEYCVSQSVVAGYDDGLYHPERVVTRDQMAVYIARAFGLL